VTAAALWWLRLLPIICPSKQRPAAFSDATKLSSGLSKRRGEIHCPVRGSSGHLRRPWLRRT